MLKRIPVQVVYASSNFAGAKHIEQHDGNNSDSWVSDIFSEWPQCLIMRVNSGKPTVISQLQVMSHEACIPQRVEVLVGNQESAEPHFEDFHTLGYFHFTDNKESELKAREVKTISFNVRCNLVMLKFYSCHMNSRNLFNQIGIARITVLGDWVQETLTNYGYTDRPRSHRNNSLEQDMVVKSPSDFFSDGESLVDVSSMKAPKGGIEIFHRRNSDRAQLALNPDLPQLNVVNPTEMDISLPTYANKNPREYTVRQNSDEVSFDMQFDCTTAIKIRECQAAKIFWAKQSEFKKAAIFKSVENKLKRAGTEIAGLELLKSSAIASEDFKTAERMSLEIDAARKKIIEDLHDQEMYQQFIREFKARATQNSGGPTLKK